jgi:hypothetical protein
MISRLSALLLTLCGGSWAEASAAAPYRSGWLAAMVRGSYVAVGEACSAPSTVVHYDGYGVRWIGRGSGRGAIYPIRRQGAGPEEWMDREVGIPITALGDGERIVVTTNKRILMRICPEDALPIWARERPVFMRYLPGKAPVELNAPWGGVLAQRAQCLGVIGDDGRFATAVWPATARIEFDARGLVVVDGEGPGRVRLGDYVQFSGGPLPTGTRYPLGGDVHVVEMPMACAKWPGYDGWIAIVNPGFRKRQSKPVGPAGAGLVPPAAASAVGLLPIPTGAYVEQGETCGNPGSLFRYDGRGMGWTRGAVRPMYPIVRVREEPGQWVATIVSPGPGDRPEPRELDVIIVPRGGGRVMVRAMERVEMTLCAPEELPAALR